MNTPQVPNLADLLSTCVIDTPIARELQIVVNRALNDKIGKMLFKELSLLAPSQLQQLSRTLYNRNRQNHRERQEALKVFLKSMEG